MKIEDKIKSGRQYRAMVLTPDEEEKEGYKVRGYASTFNEPYLLYKYDGTEFWEQVDPDAFKNTDMSDVIMQYDHEGRVYARISNKTLNISTDDHGLLVEADLSGTEEGRKLYEEIKGGYTTKMSFGFTVTKDKVEELNEEGEATKYVRTILEVGKLYDVSAVSLPANDGTIISARAFCDGVMAEREAERLLSEERNRKIKELDLKIKLMQLTE